MFLLEERKLGLLRLEFVDFGCHEFELGLRLCAAEVRNEERALAVVPANDLVVVFSESARVSPVCVLAMSHLLPRFLLD